MPAVLAAIILPAVVYAGGVRRLRYRAGQRAACWRRWYRGAVAWASKSVWATIGVGMAALWVLQWLG